MYILVELDGKFQVEPPFYSLNRKVMKLHNRAVVQVKVQRIHYRPNEATWEMEDTTQKKHPYLFDEYGHTQADASCKGEEI